MSQTSQQQQDVKQGGAQVYRGSCHCGAVRFEATLDLGARASRCNCTICMKVGGTSMVMKPDAFRLLSGREHVGEYRVGQSPNSRSFCKHCGVHAFGQGDVPEIGGLFASVNVDCLDGVELSTLKVGYWDGRHDNWQAGMREQPWPNLG
jgi:hypothetical protein